MTYQPEWVFQDDNVRVEWDDIGEGKMGEYNPDDPDDVELLRFSVWRYSDGDWHYVDDSSYCTNFPVTASAALRERALKYLHSEVVDDVVDGNSIKRLCEELSWIDTSWIEEGMSR